MSLRKEPSDDHTILVLPVVVSCDSIISIPTATPLSLHLCSACQLGKPEPGKLGELGNADLNEKLCNEGLDQFFRSLKQLTAITELNLRFEATSLHSPV
jgi:hypothetical protein